MSLSGSECLLQKDNRGKKLPLLFAYNPFLTTLEAVTYTSMICFSILLAYTSQQISLDVREP